MCVLEGKGVRVRPAPYSLMSPVSPLLLVFGVAACSRVALRLIVWLCGGLRPLHQAIESLEDRMTKRLLSKRQALRLFLNVLLGLKDSLQVDDVGIAGPQATDTICRVTFMFVKSPFCFEVRLVLIRCVCNAIAAGGERFVLQLCFGWLLVYGCVCLFSI